MKIVEATSPVALLALLALSLLACDRPKDAGHAVSSAKDAGSTVAQYTPEAGYGMPNPQPGSPISPSYDAGIAPPAPTPSAPYVPNAPPPPAPLPGTPPGTPSPTYP